MSILVDSQIIELANNGLVTPFDPLLVNPNSLDIRLGNEIMYESESFWGDSKYKLLNISECTPTKPYRLQPSQFILACSLETFNLPVNITAQLFLKSSRARIGFDHCLAGMCDAGWSGVLTLELKNVNQFSELFIWPGLTIGQLVFHRLDNVPDKSYQVTGRYNNDKSVQTAK